MSKTPFRLERGGVFVAEAHKGGKGSMFLEILQIRRWPL